MSSTSAVALAAALAAGLLVGVVVGAGGVGLFAVADGEVSGPDPETPPYSYGSGTGCIDPATADAGWLTVAAVEDARRVAFNYTVAHDRNGTATLDVRRFAPGRYVLELRTASAREPGPDLPADCRPGTTVDASVTLPSDYDELRLVVDGEVVRSVGNAGETRTKLWLLGDRGNATA